MPTLAPDDNPLQLRLPTRVATGSGNLRSTEPLCAMARTNAKIGSEVRRFYTVQHLPHKRTRTFVCNVCKKTRSDRVDALVSHLLDHKGEDSPLSPEQIKRFTAFRKSSGAKRGRASADALLSAPAVSRQEPPAKRRADSERASGGSSASQAEQPDSSFDPRREGMDPFVDRELAKAEKNELDAAVADLILEADLPFSLVDHPKFVQLCKKLRPRYTPPTRKTTSQTLLNDRYRACRREIQEELKVAEHITIAMDSWTSKSGKRFLGYCALLDDQSPLYLGSALLPHRERAKDIIKATVEFLSGPKSVMRLPDGCSLTGKISAFVSDNASVMVKALKALCKEYNARHIGCVAHSCSLAMHDIANLPYFSAASKLHKLGRSLRKSIRFSSYLQEKGMRRVPLPGTTRWLSSFELINYLLSIRPTLAGLKVRSGDEGDPEAYEIFTRDVLQLIDDEAMWTAGRDLVSVTRPLVAHLLLVEADRVDLAAVARSATDLMDRVPKALQRAGEGTGATREAIKRVMTHRLPSLAPRACYLANLLRPSWPGSASNSFQAASGPDTAAPSAGGGVAASGAEASTLIPLRSLLQEALSWVPQSLAKQYKDDETLRAAVSSDLQRWVRGGAGALHMAPDPYAKEGDEGQGPLPFVEGKDEAWEWWGANGEADPLLSAIANRVLRLTITGCSIERVWSAFGVTMGGLRSRLDPERANKMLILKWNAVRKRLLAQPRQRKPRRDVLGIVPAGQGAGTGSSAAGADEGAEGEASATTATSEPAPGTECLQLVEDSMDRAGRAAAARKGATPMGEEVDFEWDEDGTDWVSASSDEGESDLEKYVAQQVSSATDGDDEGESGDADEGDEDDDDLN